MTPDQDRWGEASSIEQQHGSEAPRWVAEQIGPMAIKSDRQGILRFQGIASRLDKLLPHQGRGGLQ